MTLDSFLRAECEAKKARLLLLFSVLGQAKHRSNDTEGTKAQEKAKKSRTVIIFAILSVIKKVG